MRKKMFAMLLAVMLALSLGSIAAYAAGPDPPSGYLDPTTANSVNFPIRYRINQESTKNPATTFCFNLVSRSYYTDPTDDTPQNETEITFPNVTVTNAAFGYGAGTVAGTLENAVFSIPVIPGVGIYEYTYDVVSEPPVDMDCSRVTLRLSVFHGKEPDTKYLAVNFIGPANKIAEIGAEYSAYEYAVVKEVDGNLGDRNKDFTFSVVLSGEWQTEVPAGHEEVVGYPRVTVSYSGGSVDNESFALEDEITKTSVISNQGTASEYTTYTYSLAKTVTFSLKHDQRLTFTNLPEGVTVTTTENNYGSEGYVTTIDDNEVREATYRIRRPEPVMDDSSGEPVPATDPDTGEIVYQGGNGSVTVVNTKNVAIDTGVILDNLPYIIAVVFVIVCGVLFFIVKKRRNSDDD